MNGKRVKYVVMFVLAFIGCAYLVNRDGREPVDIIIAREGAAASFDRSFERIPLSDDVPPAVDIWIAGVKASKNVGQYAPERPDDLDPYLRWMPPVARKKWLDKTDKVLRDKFSHQGSVELTDVYFHLGYKDKPATCGNVDLTDIKPDNTSSTQRFIYTGRSTVMLEADLPAIFNQFWLNLCVDKPYQANDS